MDTEKKFRTKTGYCHILSDKLVLTRDGFIGNVAKVTVGNNISRILIVYGIISCGLIYFAVDYYKRDDIIMVILFALIALYLIYGIFRSLNNSATPIIDRRSIQRIKFIKGISGLTRSRFEVFFIDSNGKVKRRLIMLPGSMRDGQNETIIACKMMSDEKLL
jgi:hypothetical protein